MQDTNLEDYLDLKTFIKKYPQFTEGQLRWIVVCKDKLGLADAIKRVGKRLYFHVPTFVKWIESQNA